MNDVVSWTVTLRPSTQVIPPPSLSPEYQIKWTRLWVLRDQTIGSKCPHSFSPRRQVIHNHKHTFYQFISNWHPSTWLTELDVWKWQSDQWRWLMCNNYPNDKLQMWYFVEWAFPPPPPLPPPPPPPPPPPLLSQSVVCCRFQRILEPLVISLRFLFAFL